MQNILGLIHQCFLHKTKSLFVIYNSLGFKNLCMSLQENFTISATYGTSFHVAVRQGKPAISSHSVKNYRMQRI